MTVAERIEIEHQSTTCAVAFADESQVVGGNFWGNIRRRKIENQQQQGPTIRAGFAILSVVVSQDGQWIVSGDAGGRTIVWDAATHKKVHTFTEYLTVVTAVDISSDCTKVVSAHLAGTIRIRDITSGTQLLHPSSRVGILGVKFSPDGSRFATLASGNAFRVYNTHDGDILFSSGRKFLDNSAWTVTPLAWSLDGQQLFVGGKGKITCFDISNSSSSEWSIHESRSYASITSNGRFIACSAGKSVSLWDCVTHKQIGGIITEIGDINCIALSPSGGYLACGLYNSSLTVHNLRDVLPLEYFIRDLLTSPFPLVRMSGRVLESWTQGNLKHTEKLFTKEIKSSSCPNLYLLADRALIRAHLKCVALAIEDAGESLRVQPSPIGYIAMAVAQLAQGDREEALRVFDFAFNVCEPHDNKLLLLLKSILVFESGNKEDAITRVDHLAKRAQDDNDDDATYLCTQVLGTMYMRKGNYGHAIPMLQRAKNLAPKDKQCPPLMTISFIFGWTFDGLDVVVLHGLCETLYAQGRTVEAVDILLNIIRIPDEEIQGSGITADWMADFTQRCVVTLERTGDEALGHAKYDDAITQYSTALSLDPPSSTGLFLKRSRARTAKGLWEDALQDATEAVNADPSSPWGYEAKHMAFRRAKQYDKSITAFDSMLHSIERSHDPAIRRLRKNYISPSETTATVVAVARGFLKGSPIVVIDLVTGRLCDDSKRIDVFKADSSFKELISSMTRKVDDERIHHVVTRFFSYAMFSHVWQGNEPSFQDVNSVESVWNLPKTPSSNKLWNFCKEVRRLGYRWAWSDTCCIDKTTSSILNQSLTSMYKWYTDSAVTLVFLAGVAHPSKPRDITRSVWMTRAWTLQELLAPKVIFFYDSTWKPYLGNTGTNHKECPEIMQELADAIKIPRGAIVTFSPGMLGVREKLRLASTRNATVEEDVAYSLIGIFESDIRPYYGEGANALGHLLEEIVTRFGEVTVLAWSGTTSSYNSCLPASISVYNQTPYNPPPLEGEEMKNRIAELCRKVSRREAARIYNQIKSLPPARFAARRLYLPCIVFPVRALIIQGDRRGDEKLYHAEVSGIGNVEFTTTDNLTADERKKFVLAHPWIRHIRGSSSEVTGENEPESDVDADSDSDSDGSTGLDEDVRSHGVAISQVDSYVRALQMIARLSQPFNALLFVQHPNGEYKRVAAENDIIVPGLGTDITPRNIRTRILEIL